MLLPGHDHGAPDRVRRRRRTARAVDPHHDGADARILAGVANRLDDAVGAHGGAVERVIAALAGHNRAGGVDHRDTWPAVEPERFQADAGVVFALDFTS